MARTQSVVSAKPVGATAEDSDGQHWIVPLALLSLVTPVFFQIGSLSMSPSRVLFIIMVPILTIRLAVRKEFRLLDYCIYFKIFWMFLTAAINTPHQVVQYIGSNAIDILGGYLIARCYIRNATQFLAFARFFALIVILLLPLAAIEALTSVLVIPPLIEKIPGVTSYGIVNFHIRHGLDRAQVVFAHPIHFGLFCAMAFSFAFVGLKHSVKLVTRWLWSGGVILACFFSVSSGPFLAIFIQIGLIGYNWVLRNVPLRWPILVWGSVSTYVILDILSNRPAYYAILDRIAFSSATLNVRRILLDTGMAQIARTPIFGNGVFRPFGLPHWLKGSIDNFWLADAINYGIPAILPLMIAFVVTMVQIGRRPFDPGSKSNTARDAWMFTMVGLFFALSTVTVWTEALSLTFYVFGSGMWMLSATEPARETASAEEEADPSEKPRSRYTRFPVRPTAATSVPTSRLSSTRKIIRS